MGVLKGSKWSCFVLIPLGLCDYYVAVFFLFSIFRLLSIACLASFLLYGIVMGPDNV
jgi:hypothetical protein